MFFEYLFYNGGEVLHFQQVFFFGDVFGAVGGGKGGAELGDDFAAVADGADIVDGHACLGFASGFDGFVYVVSPHAFAAELGQQGGVEVDDAAGECLNEVVGDEGQEACQDNELNVVLAKDGQHVGRVCQLCLGDDGGGYV